MREVRGFSQLSTGADAEGQSFSTKRRRLDALWAWRGGCRWLLPLAGFVSLLWFLVRVLPKPSRAAYPCQRAAAPLASAFVLWLLGVAATARAYAKAKQLTWQGKSGKAWTCFILAAMGAGAVLVNLPHLSASADGPPVHAPLGTAQGIQPGRVVWVHAPDATDWDGFDSPEHWWEPNHTDLAVVEDMLSRAVQAVAGERDDAAAWAAIFRHFNQTHGRGERGYRPGEKVAIKLNLSASNARDPEVDPITYQKKPAAMNTIDNSPQLVLALLRQLVYAVGVDPSDITVGDPTGMIPTFMWDLWHPEFPAVRYLDNVGGAGRTRAEFSTEPVFWSTAAADGKLQDYVPARFAEADYLINFAVLKGHAAGVTLCGKNLYGALLRCPDGYLREVGVTNYYDLHQSLPMPHTSPGRGQYRAVVDLMGHPKLGGKTLLCLIDGLFGGYYWDAHPYKWKTAPFGDGVNGDWPSSLFASQDPVAIDSVAFDFLFHEWPAVVTGGVWGPGALQGGAEDYLHEAALADHPPSGTLYDPARSGARLASLGVHEHWNNPVEKKYSRNLGLSQGIELVALTVNRSAPSVTIRRIGNGAVVSWPASQTGFLLQATTSLFSPAWSTIANAPVVVQGRNTVSNELVGDVQFYRLIK